MPLAGSAATHRYTATSGTQYCAPFRRSYSKVASSRCLDAGQLLCPHACHSMGPSATLVLCKKCLAKYGWQSVPADSAVGMDVFSA